MSHNRTVKLIVELLEDRTLMSASGLIANNDGPIATFKNAPITIDVLANDINQNGGTLSVVNLTQDAKGIATVNPDNTVTFNPNTDVLGQVMLGYVLTNGQETATATVYIDIFKTPSELYADYLAAVSQADQAYVGAVQTAANVAQSAVDTSQSSLQLAGDQLFATYQSASLAAQQGYDNAHATIVANYNSALDQAYIAAATRINASEGSFQSALVTAQSTLDQTLQAAAAQFEQSLQLAEATYDTTVAPYQSARDQAYTAYLANPENAEAQTALEPIRITVLSV